MVKQELFSLTLGFATPFLVDDVVFQVEEKMPESAKQLSQVQSFYLPCLC
jgi:hypothetical protein